MAFVESRFPESVSDGTVAGPGYNTQVVETGDGREIRISRWNGARRRFDVAKGIRSQSALYEVYEFFLAIKGAATGFRFRDPFDFSTGANGIGATNAKDVLIGVGDGSTKQFQCLKRYTVDGEEVVRNITKVFDSGTGKVKVSLNDVDQSSGWSVNTSTGVITFSSAPALGVEVKWGGYFDTPVRFSETSDDRLGFTLQNFEAGSSKLVLTEIPDFQGVSDPISAGGSRVVEFDSVGGSTSYTASISDARVYAITASDAGELILPSLFTLPTGGPVFVVLNNGPNNCTIKRSDLTTLIVLTNGQFAELYVIEDQDTLDRSWDVVQ